jgi:hypothetical protein
VIPIPPPSLHPFSDPGIRAHSLQSLAYVRIPVQSLAYVRIPFQSIAYVRIPRSEPRKGTHPLAHVQPVQPVTRTYLPPHSIAYVRIPFR